MMRPRVTLAAGLLACLSGATAAQEGGPIRSGEHVGFSRIVLSIEPSTEWSLENAGREARIFFPGKSLDFGTDNLFERMPRTRILGVVTADQAGGTLVTVQLGCECRVTTSFVGARYLALDVHDRETRSLGAAPSAPRPPKSLAALVAPELPDLTITDGAVSPPPAEPDASDRRDLLVPTAAARDVSDPVALPGHVSAFGIEAMRGPEAIANAERILIEQIERAANQGLIELAGEDVIAELRGAAPTSSTSGRAENASLDRTAPTVPALPEAALPRPADPATAAPPPLAAPLADRPPLAGAPVATLLAQDQVEAITVFDRDSASIARALAADIPPAGCVDDAQLDIERWSNGEPLHRQLAKLQAELFGEFDRPNPEAVRDVARLYIRFGFGAEAKQILDTIEADFPERPLLGDLSRAVESRPLLPEGPLSAPAPCPGRHGLWQAVAGTGPGLSDSQRLDSLQEAFQDLPADLRRLVGPTLVGRLIDAGHETEAALIFDIATRSGALATDDLRLAAGRLDAAAGRYEQAEIKLAALVTNNAWNSADALARMVETRLLQDAPVPQAWITDLDAAALERRGSAEEVPLRRLRAESLARNNALPEALATLVALGRDRPDAADLVESAATRLLARAEPEAIGPAAYAETMLAHSGMISRRPGNDPARLAISARLIELGLPKAALAILDPAIDRGLAPARRSAAQAHLGLDRPDAALAVLNGESGTEAAALRARAHARKGAFEAAVQAVTDGGGGIDPTPYAWASGAWDLVGDAASPEQATMAAYMRLEGATAPSAPDEATLASLTPAAAFASHLPNLDQPSLRNARALVATGREVGAFVENLLARN